MILSYMYPIRTNQKAASKKQGTAKAANHHHKRAKGARGQGGSAEGVGLFRAISQGAAARQGPRLQTLGPMRRYGAGSALVGALCA